MQIFENFRQNKSRACFEIVDSEGTKTIPFQKAIAYLHHNNDETTFVFRKVKKNMFSSM